MSTLNFVEQQVLHYLQFSSVDAERISVSDISEATKLSGIDVVNAIQTLRDLGYVGLEALGGWTDSKGANDENV
jgi:DNA-binding IclR family transcriptional regulator